MSNDSVGSEKNEDPVSILVTLVQLVSATVHILQFHTGNENNINSKITFFPSFIQFLLFNGISFAESPYVLIVFVILQDAT